MSSEKWSPELVEKLILRQFLKGEDVANSLPPPPTISDGKKERGYMRVELEYTEATKALIKYLRIGPTPCVGAASGPLTARHGKSFSPSMSQTGEASLASVNGQPGQRHALNASLRENALNNAGGGQISARGQQGNASPGGNNTLRSPRGGANQATLPFVNCRTACSQVHVEFPKNVPLNKELLTGKQKAPAKLINYRLLAQSSVDPDLIFAPPKGEIPLDDVLRSYPDAIKRLAAKRGPSGDWRLDFFTVSDEKTYKEALGFKYIGPSQRRKTTTDEC